MSANCGSGLQTIRRDGFAVSLGETVPGAAGVAAPIFNADGSVTAGLLIAAPIERFEKQLPRFKRLLQDATSIVSGITPPPAAVEPKPAAVPLGARCPGRRLTRLRSTFKIPNSVQELTRATHRHDQTLSRALCRPDRARQYRPQRHAGERAALFERAAVGGVSGPRDVAQRHGRARLLLLLGAPSITSSAKATSASPI